MSTTRGAIRNASRTGRLSGSETFGEALEE